MAAQKHGDHMVVDSALQGIELRVRYAKNDALDMEWERIAIRMATISELASDAATAARRLQAAQGQR